MCSTTMLILGRQPHSHQLQMLWKIFLEGYDVICTMQVIAAGGLHVIGTERHESRRIDNQVSDLQEVLSTFVSEVLIVNFC